MIPFLKQKYIKLEKIIFFSFIVSIYLGLHSCTVPKSERLYSYETTKDILSPIRMHPEETVLYLKGYVYEPIHIKDWIFPDGLDSTFFLKNETLKLYGNIKNTLDIIQFTIDDNVYAIPIIRSKKKYIIFSFTPEKGTTPKDIKLKGEMNGWNPSKMEKQNNGTWQKGFLPGPR